MNKNFIIKHTNKLIKIASNRSRSSQVGKFPYPEKPFGNQKEFKEYLNTLTNFIDTPEYFYLSKDHSNCVEKYKPGPKQYFNFLS